MKRLKVLWRFNISTCSCFTIITVILWKSFKFRALLYSFFITEENMKLIGKQTAGTEYECLENLFFVEFVKNIKLWHKWFCLRIYDLFWCHLSISYQNMINLSLRKFWIGAKQILLLCSHLCDILQGRCYWNSVLCVDTKMKQLHNHGTSHNKTRTMFKLLWGSR